MLPDGWDISALDGSVSKIIDCKHRTPKYVDSGVPLVSPGTIKWGALDLVSPKKHVSDEEYESLMDHCTVDVGDMVLSRNQSIGVASYVENDAPFVLGQDTVLVKPKSSQRRFLFYALQSSSVQREIFKLSGGSTFSRINLGDIRKLRIILPPFSEQEKIAEMLSTWDEAITTTEKLIENSQQQKKALMQQLLTGKKRLPGFSDDWREVKLSEIVNVSKGKALSSKDLKPGYYPVIAGGKTSPYSHSDFTHENIITVSASGAYAGYVAFHNQKIWASDCSVIESTGDSDISFIYQYLKSIQHKIYNLQSGGAQPHVYPKDLEVLKVNLPGIDEQKSIENVLANADLEIDLLKDKLGFLQQEKKALMQQLLTGKKRVKLN